MARKVGRQVMKAKWMILTVLCVIFRVSLVFAQKEFQVEQHQDTKSNGNQGKQSEQTALRKHIVAKDGAEMVLIPAGEFEMGSNNLHRRVVGQKLEILLLQNPYQLSPGNALEVQVLFDGKPLDDHLVTALNGDVKRRIFGKQRQTGATGPLYNQGKQSEQTALRKHIVAKDGAEMVLIPAGEFEMGSNNLHRRVVGQKLEILLLQNPYQLSPGNALEVQVLFDGKPLDDHLVTALNGDVKRRIFGKQRQTGATGPLYYKECEIIYGQVLISLKTDVLVTSVQGKW
jgi:uncharacterized GH25 family protein